MYKASARRQDGPLKWGPFHFSDSVYLNSGGVCDVCKALCAVYDCYCSRLRKFNNRTTSSLLKQLSDLGVVPYEDAH